MPDSLDVDFNRQCDLKYLLDRLDDQIRVEIDLIGHRMNVLVVSQAFLLAAFTTDLLTKDSKFNKLEAALLRVIPGVGMIICILLGLSLFAAVLVVRSRKLERDIVRDRLCRDMRQTTLSGDIFAKHIEILEHVSPGSFVHRFGNYPPVFLAPLILGFWIYLLYVTLN